MQAILLASSVIDVIGTFKSFFFKEFRNHTFMIFLSDCIEDSNESCEDTDILILIDCQSLGQIDLLVAKSKEHY
jgi:hypothetical protein